MTTVIWPDFNNPLGGFGGFFEEHPLEKESHEDSRQEPSPAGDQIEVEGKIN